MVMPENKLGLDPLMIYGIGPVPEWAGRGFPYLVGISDYRVCCVSGGICLFKENQKNKGG